MTTGQKPGLRRFAATLLATAASAFAMGSAHAAYPDKPVRIVVGFSAGGTTDVIARIMAKELTESLGQSFVVENKPGAGSNIATDQVKRADPDGYTLLFVAVTSAINQTLYKNVNFDLTKDFAPVALGAKVPNILVVNPEVPVKSVKELVDYAKKNPGKLAFASSGSGTSIHMAGELFKMKARALQGQRPGHDRPDRWPGAVHVRQHAVCLAARPIGQAARPGRDHQRPLQERAGPAHDAGIGLCRV
jgi:tripartite-type tricarboxylate transporter receptor subunit TctC